MFSTHNKIEDYILKRLSNYDLTLAYDGHEIEITTPADSLYNVLSFLVHDTHCHFDQLLDLIVLDSPPSKKRFQLIYIVRSVKNNQCLRIRTTTGEEIASVSEVYRNALWLEREAWEMFGVFFKNSRDPRRLLTTFKVGGHPLRKDYPIEGFSDYVLNPKDGQFLSVPLAHQAKYRFASRETVPSKGQELKNNPAQQEINTETIPSLSEDIF